jgi:hypothetical protein
MKKVIRLTESDLVRIVKRVINEQAKPMELNNLIHHANVKHPQYNPTGLKIGEIIKQNGGIETVLATLSQSDIDNDQRYDIGKIIIDKFGGYSATPSDIKYKIEDWRKETTGEKITSNVRNMFKGDRDTYGTEDPAMFKQGKVNTRAFKKPGTSAGSL